MLANHSISMQVNYPGQLLLKSDCMIPTLLQ